MIATLLVTRLPEWYTARDDYRSYDFRGWTFFERSSAELIKPSQAYVVEEGKTNAEGRWLWPMIIDSSVEDANEGRRPPLAPVAFTELLQTKRFTNDADVDGVARLYEKTATQVLGATPKLELNHMPVREGDGARLAQAFALCHALEEFSWCFTKLPAVEVRALLSTPMPTLRKLFLQEASLGEAGGVALAEALGKGVAPHLEILQLAGNALGEAGGVALAEALGKGVAPHLEILNLMNNALGETGGVAVAEALAKGVAPQLQSLGLNGNGLGDRGALALAAAIRAPDALPSLTGLDVERTGVCLLYTSPSPRDMRRSRMPSSA